MIAASFKGEKRHRRVSLTAVRRAGYGHLTAVDPGAVAKIDDNISIEQVVAGIGGYRWIGAEVRTIGALRRWQRQVYAPPTRTAIRRKIPPHREAKYLI